MNIKFRNYENTSRFGDDYHKVCDFLKRINSIKVITPNFLWARWVWMISRPVDNEDLKNRIGLWEVEQKVVALATFEGTFCELFILVDPEYDYLKQEILNYAKTNLSNDDKVKVMIPDNDLKFRDLAFNCGFRSTQSGETISIIEINDAIKYDLPEGFHIVSLDDGWDFNQYNRVMWRGFDHEGEAPEDEEDINWRKTMLSSPHLEPKLMVAIVAPNGNYVAHCGLWCNPGDHYAYVEPVATDPEYRKMGLGKAAIYETLLRAKQMGAREAYVISSQQFYYNIGFKRSSIETWWEL